MIWRPLEANFASVLHSLYDAGVHTILYLGSTLLFFQFMLDRMIYINFYRSISHDLRVFDILMRAITVA